MSILNPRLSKKCPLDLGNVKEAKEILTSGNCLALIMSLRKISDLISWKFHGSFETSSSRSLKKSLIFSVLFPFVYPFEKIRFLVKTPDVKLLKSSVFYDISNLSCFIKQKIPAGFFQLFMPIFKRKF